MRITQNVMIGNFLRNYNKNLGKMDKLYLQMSSGSRINKPSDDPAGLVTSMRLRTKLRENEQYKENVGDAISWVEKADSALGTYGDVLQRIRELTVKAANGTNESSALEAIHDEVEQLKEEIADIANSTLDDRYIFGGSHTMEQVYDVASDTWNGNTGAIKFETGQDIVMQVNIGGEVFGIDFSGDTPDTSNSIFATLDKILTDITNGDYEELGGNDLQLLDDHINVGLSARSKMGAKYNRLEMINSRLADMEINYEQVLSTNEDVDMAQLVIDLTNQENVYRASLSAGAKIIQPSLVDFLS